LGGQSVALENNTALGKQCCTGKILNLGNKKALICEGFLGENVARFNRAYALFDTPSAEGI